MSWQVMDIPVAFTLFTICQFEHLYIIYTIEHYVLLTVFHKTNTLEKKLHTTEDDAHV